MASTGDKIWYQDIPVLAKRWKEFFPTPQHTTAERTNALVRLVAYATAAAFVYNRQARTLVMGAGVVAVLSFVYGYQHRANHRRPGPDVDTNAATAKTAPPSDPSDAGCTRPTRDNPFANILLTDLGKPSRAPACPYDAVKDSIRDNFNAGLFRDALDVYERGNSQRQFHTMPVTTTLPDTKAFSNFLYGDMKSCKENAIHCPSRIF
jgi:hypothetical protein